MGTRPMALYLGDFQSQFHCQANLAGNLAWVLIEVLEIHQVGKVPTENDRKCTDQTSEYQLIRPLGKIHSFK